MDLPYTYGLKLPAKLASLYGPRSDCKDYVCACLFATTGYHSGMNILSPERFLLMLLEVRGASFATLTTVTDARLRKTGNPFGPVQKIATVNVTLGFQYAASVNRQRIREDATPDFVAMERAWGERSKLSPMLIEHKGKLYLEAKVERSLSYEYRTADGRLLTHAEVEPFLPTRGPSRQGVEKEILVRDYALDSIAGISFQGQSFLIAPIETQKAA